MKITVLCIFALVLCGFTTEEKSHPEASQTWVLRFDGIGPIRVGMTLKELNTALVQNFSVPVAEDEQACYYLELKGHPDTAIMMLDGRVARVDVFVDEKNTSSTTTAAGVRVGDSEERVRELYGNAVVVEPHYYTDGHYLTIRSGKHGIRFETDQNKVTSFYAGISEAIGFVEGCS
jgi:hypothetical protein